MESMEKVLIRYGIIHITAIIVNKAVKLGRIYHHLISASCSHYLIPLGPTDMTLFVETLFLS